MLIKNNTKTTKIKRSNKAAKPNSTKASSGSWKEIRAEKVARAKKLLEQPGYPSGKVINSIARLMAKHLSK
jgi:hypothetical protein